MLTHCPLKKFTATRYIQWYIFFVSFLLFYFFSIKAYTGDALYYSGAVEFGLFKDLFHPHHLLYNLFNRILYYSVKVIGFQMPSIIFMQIINCIWGALNLFLFYNITYFLFHKFELSIVMTLILMSSYEFWYNTSNPEVYLSGLFFLHLSFFLIIQLNENFSLSAIVKVTVTTSLAILFNQPNIFFVIIALLIIILMPIPQQRKKIFIVIFIPLSFAIVAGTYLFIAVTVMDIKNPEAFLYWITTYAHNGLWGNFKLNSINQSINSLIHIFLGGKNQFPLILRILSGDISWRNILLLFISGGIVWTVIRLIFLIVKNRKRIDIKDHHFLIIPFTVWFFLYYFFYTWWDPEISEHLLILVLPVIVIPGFLLFNLTDKQIMRNIYFFVIFLFCYNFLGFILPKTSLTFDKNLQITQYMSSSRDLHSFIIIPGYMPYNEQAYFDYYMYKNLEYRKNYPVNEYFFLEKLKEKYKNNVTLFQRDFKQVIDDNLNSGIKVYIDDRIYNPDDTIKGWYIWQGVEECENKINTLLNSYDIVPVYTQNKHTVLWEIVKQKEKI